MMRPLTQLHNPPDVMEYDCMRTVLACIFECESVHDVPNFAWGLSNPGSDDEAKEFWQRCNDWLYDKHKLGLHIIEWEGDEFRTVPQFLKHLKGLYEPWQWVIMMGESKVSRQNHVVVARDGKFQWDPSRDGGNTNTIHRPSICPNGDRKWVAATLAYRSLKWA